MSVDSPMHCLALRSYAKPSVQVWGEMIKRLFLSFWPSRGNLWQPSTGLMEYYLKWGYKVKSAVNSLLFHQYTLDGCLTRFLDYIKMRWHVCRVWPYRCKWMECLQTWLQWKVLPVRLQAGYKAELQPELPTSCKDGISSFQRQRRWKQELGASIPLHTHSNT